MPFPQERTCADCGDTFMATHYSQNYCRHCQTDRNTERNHNRERPVRDDTAWINSYIDNNGYIFYCSVCGRHMTRCRCAETDVRTFEPPAVATWQPWK